MWMGRLECWRSSAHNIGHVHGCDQLPQGVVVSGRHGHHVVLELRRVSVATGHERCSGKLSNLHPTLKSTLLHLRNGDELRFDVAGSLRVLHVHQLQSWNEVEALMWGHFLSSSIDPPHRERLTLWRFGVVLPKGLVFGDVGVKEAQRVFRDVLCRHHLVGADDVGQRDGWQLLLGVGLHRVEHRLVCVQRVVKDTFQFSDFSF